MKHIFSKYQYPTHAYPGMIFGGKYVCGAYKGSMPFVCTYRYNNEIWFLGTRSIAGNEIYMPRSSMTRIENSLTWDQAHDLTFKVRLYLMYDEFTALGRIPTYKDINEMDFDANYYGIERSYWLASESTIAHGFYVNQIGYIRGDAWKNDKTIGVVPIVKLRFEGGEEEN